jgi:hypothetical protein
LTDCRKEPAVSRAAAEKVAKEIAEVAKEIAVSVVNVSTRWSLEEGVNKI